MGRLMWDHDSDKYKRRKPKHAQYGGNFVYVGLALVMFGVVIYLNTPVYVTHHSNAIVTGKFSFEQGTFEEFDNEVKATTASQDGDIPKISATATKRDNSFIKNYPRYDDGAAKNDDLLSPDDPSIEIVEDQPDAGRGENKQEGLGQGDGGEEEQDGNGDGEGEGEQRDYGEGDSDDIFQDQAAFENAPFIKVLPESKTRKYSRIVLAHERYYRQHPSRLYVPTLKKSSRLSLEDFKRMFMDKSQPVVIPFEAMRHLNNFTTKAGWTLEELHELYPNSVPALYKYGALIKKDIDIGPAVASLMDNKKLRKTQIGKSYPRNTKFVLSSLKKLNLQPLPFVPPNFTMMLPSLWFASTAEATPLHSDCCDNWAMMVSGTKKWYLAPPNEARILKPNCKGGLCWVKQLPHADEHAATKQQQRLRDNTQFLQVDVPAGHVLYLPAGWFHHVEQEMPTCMINFWSKEGPAFLHYLRRQKQGTPAAQAASDSHDIPFTST